MKTFKQLSEELNELKKSTLGSYIKKSARDAVDYMAHAESPGDITMAKKRLRGIDRATKKLGESSDIESENIRKDWKGHSKLSKDALKRLVHQTSKVIDSSGMNKFDMIHHIMHSKHGAKRMQAAFPD
jgi:hypothetical protein